MMLLVGGAMLPVEVARIIQGSLNRSVQGSYLLYPNYNALRNKANTAIIAFLPDVLVNSPAQPNLAQKGIIPFDATSSSSFNNFPIQDKYLWPWSHAALLFSLVTMAAGLAGLVSSCKRTYASIYTFFALSLLSWMLSIFLITYYSVIVYYGSTKNSAGRAASYWAEIDFRLGAAMLALSCLCFLVSMQSACCSGCAFGIGSAKAKLQKINKRQRNQAGY